MTELAHELTSPRQVRRRNAWRALGHWFIGLWFAPVSATNLALARVILFGGGWYVLGRPSLSQWLSYGKVAYKPVGVFELLNVPLFSAPVLEWLGATFSVAMVCAALGLMYRAASITAAVTGLYVFGLGNNFGKVDHGANVFVLSLWVFAMARAADQWSLDQLILSWWRQKRSPRSALLEVLHPIPRSSGEYRWPLEFVLLLVVVMYCAAGVAKFRYSGWAWAFSDSFQTLLLRHHFTHSPPTQWGVAIARYDSLCQGLALFTLLVETLCPIALFSRLSRWLFIPALAGLQLGIYVLMGVIFRPMLLVFLCLIPWAELGQASARLAARARTKFGRAAAAHAA